MEGWVPGSRKIGGQKKMWIDNILELTWLPMEEALRSTDDRVFTGATG